jgi:glycosyltransferase involved in cell wall biosynthesis
MRILHVATKDMSRCNGISIFLSNLIPNLQKIGIKNIILCYDEELSMNALHQEFQGITIIKYTNQIRLFAKNPILNLFSILHQLKPYYDMIHIHSYIFLTTFQTLLFCKKHNVPSILTLHGGVQTKIIKNLPLKEKCIIFFKKYLIDKTIGRWIIQLPDVLTSVSKRDLLLIGSVFNVNRNQNYYISNGVDISRFSITNTRERKYLTFIGRLDYTKGIDIFLHLIEKMKDKGYDLPIKIIGIDKSKKYSRILKLIPKCEYNEWIPYKKIGKIYKETKVLIISSRFEGLPTTLLEAMATGTPVLSTDVGGISEIISSGKNGFLFSPTNIDAGAAQLEKLLSDPKLRQKLALSAHSKIVKQFSWQQISLKYHKIYQKLVNNK